MRVNEVMPFMSPQGSASISPAKRETKQIDFSQVLAYSLNQLNNTQLNADNAVKNLVTGKADDIHTVMIAMQEAQMTLQLAVQVRNKVIEAYQEIMRMQV